jgi:hypothetical protein
MADKMADKSPGATAHRALTNRASELAAHGKQAGP